MTNPNNSNGFQEDGSGIWPDSSGSGRSNATGDPGKDFDGLTWKQIEAAIIGGGAMTGGQDNQDRAYGNVNWQSLQAAAGVFNTTQLNLAAISQSIKDQTAALAGDDGPWKGTAADNFKVMATNLSGKFDALVHMITDGGGGARDIPTQLVNSAAYLQWAQNTLRYIDSYYAAQVNARGHTLNDGRAHIADFPDAVDMMTNDMRQVGNTLAGQYNTVATSSYSPPPPGQAPPPPPPNLPPPPGGDDLPPPPNIPPPADVPPPGGAGGGGDGTGGAGDVPPPSIPPPPGGIGGDGGGGGNPPPLNAAAIPPPPGNIGGGSGGDGGAGDPPPFKNLDVKPPNFDSTGGGPGGGPGGTGLSNFDTTSPPLTSPNIPPPPGSIGGDNGDQNGGLGNIPPLTSPNLPPPPGSIGGNNGNQNGNNGLGNIKPPSIPPPPGDVKGGGGLGNLGLGNTGDGSGGTGGAGGLGGIKSPAIPPPPGSSGLGNNLTGNALNPADLPPALQTGDNQNQGGLTPPPMMPPPSGTGGAGGLGNQGSERPDSAGLLGGVDKPWLTDIPKGIGDPTSLGDTPPLSQASWAPPPGLSGGTGGTGGANSDGLGGAGSDGPGGIKGLDSSNLVPPPDLPQSLTDPNSTNGPGQAGAGGAGSGMPMMPPGGAGGGAGGLGNQGSERPDSAGLLGGIDKPWLTDVPQGIGDPTSFGETPPMESASWAPPPGATGGLGGSDLADAGVGGGADGVKGLDSSNLVPPPDLPQSLSDSNGTNGPATAGAGGAGSGMPMMPPGGAGGGAGANTPAADRPDSAGLLGGVNTAWLADSPAGVGDPSSFGDTPPSKSADWAPPSLSSVDGLSTPEAGTTGTPGMAAPPQNGTGGPAPTGDATERPDSASLLDGTSQPWTGGQVPAGAGDPAVAGDTPAAPATSWSTHPDPVPANPVPAEATPVAVTPVVHPTPVQPTTVDATPADPAPAATPGDLAPVAGWGTGDQPAAGSSWSTSAVPAVPVVIPPVQAGWGVAGSATTPATTAAQPTQSAQNTQSTHTEKHDDREGAIAGGVGGGEPDEVRVAVVQAAEVVDTSAWDTGTADFLPGLLPSSYGQREEREEDLVTDLVERSDKPWRPAGGTEDSPQLSTYQRVRVGEGEFYSDEMATCAPGPATVPLESEEDTAEAEDGEEEEEVERTMADLLSQDESAWGRPASRPSGVLE
ncbi:hypothetical protein VSH64_34860 [Amycolatopsis rhabdoformis]|uniref:PPE domain-containing protein n=1 Tax=Amycolatopsis rhabdoformis TaxID=1448059 RepID=A0ABZ1I239_9PSEU|nr:hypothetical protein [Amycolatopsis rhabdoformis]WSE27996.1 hypothetical protein VSH64_34860 [Amycolatopsis rhabdoformis]